MALPELDVTVVLPVYNEAGHVLTEVERIRAALDAPRTPTRSSWWTTGPTTARREELAAVEGIRLIRFAKNRGSGARPGGPAPLPPGAG